MITCLCAWLNLIKTELSFKTPKVSQLLHRIKHTKMCHHRFQIVCSIHFVWLCIFPVKYQRHTSNTNAYYTLYWKKLYNNIRLSTTHTDHRAFLERLRWYYRESWCVWSQNADRLWELIKVPPQLVIKPKTTGMAKKQ